MSDISSEMILTTIAVSMPTTTGLLKNRVTTTIETTTTTLLNEVATTTLSNEVSTTTLSNEVSTADLPIEMTTTTITTGLLSISPGMTTTIMPSSDIMNPSDGAASSRSGTPIPIIAGAVGGTLFAVLAAFLIITVLLICIKRRKSQNKEKSYWADQDVLQNPVYSGKSH